MTEFKPLSTFVKAAAIIFAASVFILLCLQASTYSYTVSAVHSYSAYGAHASKAAADAAMSNLFAIIAAISGYLCMQSYLLLIYLKTKVNLKKQQQEEADKS